MLARHSSDESSIDGEEDDEDRLYQQILTQSTTQKSTVDDLIDKEVIDLLKVCSYFKYPALDELSTKFVYFGE